MILARNDDATARDLAGRWPDTRVMTSRDLSRRGWQHRVGFDANLSGEARHDCAVIDGEVVPVETIEAVMGRLGGVIGGDLPHIVDEDKEYVASEMTAFLLSWLTSLPCPVINKPAPWGLAGPALRPEGWARLAASLGIPVQRIIRQSSGYLTRGAQSLRVVTRVGNRYFGDADPALHDRVRGLAEACGTDLLTVGFDAAADHAPLVAAHPWPDFSLPEVEVAVLDLLLSRARRGRVRT